ncbi:MAG: hypothetical protein V2I79_05065 [Xanthomonadales bacterium]|jgi:hypothetical protein|nr:hypothetical protein [Xanthomonadales bacterium]
MSSKSSRFFLVFILTLFSTTLPAQERAVEPRHPLLADDFSASLGAFIHDKNVELGLDGSVQVNLDEINFGDKWKLDASQTTGAGIMRWRFGEKWSVSGQYFKSSDSARAILDEDIEWGDYTFRAGTNAGAGIGLTVSRIFFGRTFHEAHNHEFGAGIGLHWLEIEGFIDGEAFINDESTGYRRERVSAGAPLPNIGAWYMHAFSPKWLLSARLDWLDASIDEYSGRLINTSLGINYQPFDHFGFGLAYQVFDLDVEVDETDWNGSAGLRYSGPFLSVTATW